MSPLLPDSIVQTAYLVRVAAYPHETPGHTCSSRVEHIEEAEAVVFFVQRSAIFWGGFVWLIAL